MYDEHAPRLIENKYHPLPILPTGKSPARYIQDRKEFVAFSAWNRIPTPIKTPQPGAGVGIRCGDGGVVALDYDHEDAALVISAGVLLAGAFAIWQGRA